MYVRQERECDPIGKPLRIITLVRAEERFERVVSRDDEARDVNKEFAGDVKEDEEEVERAQAKYQVYFRYRGLLLEVVERRIAGKLISAVSASCMIGEAFEHCAVCPVACWGCHFMSDRCAIRCWCGRVQMKHVPLCRAGTCGVVPFLVQTS